MDILKKILVIIIACGILATLFTLSIAIFIVALVLFPIIYLYQKYKMDNLFGKVAEAKRAQQQAQELETAGKTIDAEYEIIEEVKK